MRKQNVTFAVLLILAGAALLARLYVPELNILFVWPNWGFALAGFLILSALINRSGGLAVLGSLLAGVCVNLICQEATGGLIWLSMLAFLGVGLVLSSIFDPRHPNDWRSGLTLVVIALAIFLIAGGGNLLPALDQQIVGPALLIALGLVLLISALSRKNKA